MGVYGVCELCLAVAPFSLMRYQRYYRFFYCLFVCLFVYTDLACLNKDCIKLLLTITSDGLCYS